jgi:hypothetical protein
MPGLLDKAAHFIRGAASGGLEALARADAPSTNERNTSAPGGGQAETSLSHPAPTEPAKDDPKAIQWDPYQVLAQMGYRDRPSPVGYATLQAVRYRMPIVGGILQTRKNQVAAFAHPQSSRFGTGYVIRLRDRDRQLSRQDRKFVQQMETFFSRTGITDNPRGRDNFSTYLRKIVDDTYTYDAHATEIVANKKGQPAEFYAVDAATIRLADSARAHIDEDLEDATRYVQVYDGTIIAEFTQNELMYGVRNPSTNIRLQGYGTSELELLVQTVSNLVNGFEYNAKYFTQNSTPKGLLNIKAGMSTKMLNAFKQQWYAMLTGVENAWRTPITNAEQGVEWVNMQQTNQEMGFQQWIDLLIKCTCSVFCISPDEIGHPYGNAGQTSTLSQGGNRDKIIESRERGLRPLLAHIAHCINVHLLWPINEDFKFEFVGLDAMSREELAELNNKRVRSSWTVNEVRAEEDKPPLKDGSGDIILDPTWLQYYIQKNMPAPTAFGGGSSAPSGAAPDGTTPDDTDTSDNEKDDDQDAEDNESDGEKLAASLLVRKIHVPGAQELDIVRKSLALRHHLRLKP